MTELLRREVMRILGEEQSKAPKWLIEPFLNGVIDDMVRSMLTPRQRLWLEAVKRAEQALVEQYRYPLGALPTLQGEQG
jgi:hypothetical protein